MRSVRASGKPMLAAKCEKSSPMARVAEVKIQAQGRDSTYSRRRSAISNGVNCSSQAAGIGIDPAQTRIVRQLAQRGQRIGKCGAARARNWRCRRRRPSPRAAWPRSLKAVSISGKRIQEGVRADSPTRSGPARAAVRSAIPRAGLPRPAPRSIDRRRADAGGAQFRRDVAQQDLNLAHRPRLAEELRRDIRHLMRLIQDDGLGAGQQIAESLVLEREIGQQQMMIHDDDVGGLRVAARFEHMAARELRALLAEAVFARRGNARPDRRLLRQVGEFGKIARLGGRRPARHPREQACHAALARQQGALLGREFQSMPAQIVRASLEQRELRRQSQRLRQHRHVAAKQLVLQRARAGGDDDAAPRQQRRDQIGKGLARARCPPRRSAARAAPAPRPRLWPSRPARVDRHSPAAPAPAARPC